MARWRGGAVARWRGGLSVSAFVSGLNGSGSSPDCRHCVVYLGKKFYSQSVSFHPGV